MTLVKIFVVIVLSLVGPLAIEAGAVGASQCPHGAVAVFYDPVLWPGQLPSDRNGNRWRCERTTPGGRTVITDDHA